MEGGFSQETLESSCISQTIDELEQLHEAATSAASKQKSSQQNADGIHQGSQSNNQPTMSTSNAQCPASTEELINYQNNASDSTAIHLADGQILTPHYVIVEDPISLHNYADFSSSEILSNFGLPEDKTQPIILDKVSAANSFEIFVNSSTESDFASSSNEMKTKVTDSRSSRKDTILTVPVIDMQKSPNYLDSKVSEHAVENKCSVSLNEVREQLKEHLNKKEAENMELRKMKMTNDRGQTKLSHKVDGIVATNNVSSSYSTDSIDNVKISQVSSLADCAEAGTNTDIDFSVDDDMSAKKKQKTEEMITQEKTMFSENLGLIPADTETKIIAERAKNATKGVRTRKSFEIGSLTATVEPVSFPNVISKKDENKSNDIDMDDAGPMIGHTHKPGCYRCGSCTKKFMTICKLHNHLHDHCFGGSYHYDHLLKTAFPKYDTTCSYAQTNYDFDKDKAQKILKPQKPQKSNLKFKFKSSKPSVLKVSAPFTGKRKRGRPRKVQIVEEKTVSGIEEIAKLEDQCDTNEELIVKEEPVGYNIDGTLFDSSELIQEEEKADDTVKDSAEIIEDDTNTTSSFVDNYLKELDDDVNDVNKVTQGEAEEPEVGKKKARKRKSSIPRKITVSSESEEGKIVNSRVKQEMKITCEFCPSKFQYTRGLIRHEQEKHADEMKFHCDKCDQKFMREYNLERHKLCAHTEGKSKLNQQKKGIYREKKKPGRRPMEKTPDVDTPCEICGVDVPSSKLDIHIRLHTGERPFICHVCGKGLISEKKLKRHLLIHSEVQRHTCDICGQGFSMKYKLRTHMFVHTGHKPYLCSVCGAEFNNSTSLLHHNRTVHLGDKRFECTICGGRYGKKSQLEEHMFSHSSERTQTCKYCGKSFKHAKSLRRHESTHVSNQKFQCDQCESKFSRKDNLERHKMCHYEATLQCSFCKKKFRDRQPLLEHEQFHINQRKHTCQICREKFQDEQYFYNHMEKNHGISRDMVPMLSALAASPVKEVRTRRSAGERSIQNIIDPLKGTASVDDHLGLSAQSSNTIDTLNLSMSVAGILPTSVSDIGNGSQSNLPTGSLSLSHLTQQVFNVGTNTPGLNMNNGRGILNQPSSANTVSTGTVFPGMSDVQRLALNVMNTGLDQTTGNLTLNADTVLTPDQERIIQDAVEPNIPNMHGQGYRLQNLFNQ